MTWKEFKEAVEAQGIKNQDELWYIDATFLGIEKQDITVENAAVSHGLGWVILS